MGAKRRMNRRVAAIDSQATTIFVPSLNNSRNQALTDHTDHPDWNTVNPERATINRFSFLSLDSSLDGIATIAFLLFFLSLSFPRTFVFLFRLLSPFFFSPSCVSARENGSSSIDRTHRVLPKMRRGRCIDQLFFLFIYSFLDLENFLFLDSFVDSDRIEMYRDLKRCK